MDGNLAQLLPWIHRLASTVTAEQATALADLLNRTDGRTWQQRRFALFERIVHPEAQRPLERLLHEWAQSTDPPDASLVAAALLGASHTFHARQRSQSVELVWTGPEPAVARLRRTEQALIELIRSARETILVVSFAVYRADAIVAELIAALERGVQLHICVEAPEPSGEHIAYDTLAALGPTLTNQAQVYIWPQDQRPFDDNGRHGSLHAKCAVADEQMLFLSSANLTGYAMTINMELGVLITGGPQPGQVAGYFRRLVELGVLQPVV